MSPSRGGKPEGSSKTATPRRILFLDDDPFRAEIFLKEHPEAVWVKNVAQCIERLAEPWDEVHLDHDLEGEQFVDSSRDDCGMEVVRWICREPRPHLRTANFLVHSHNLQAATMMGLQLLTNGYKVDVRPFGTPPPEGEPVEVGEEPDPVFGPLRSLLVSVLRLLGLRQRSYAHGYEEYRRGGPPPAPAEPLDLSWVKRSEFRRAKPTADEPVTPIDLGWTNPSPGDDRPADLPPRSPEDATPAGPTEPDAS